jgi:hypothetical protein
MLGSNEEHLHRRDLFSNAYSARGALNQHPAIGYSHPLNTEGTFDNGPVMCRAIRESIKPYCGISRGKGDRERF